MSKITPGPWRISVCPMLEVSHLESSSVGRVFAEFDCGCKPPHGKAFKEIPYSRADARLISAAPDLLDIAMRWAALDGGAWNVTRYEHEKATLLDDTRAAIAKAEGR